MHRRRAEHPTPRYSLGRGKGGAMRKNDRLVGGTILFVRPYDADRGVGLRVHNSHSHD